MSKKQVLILGFPSINNVNKTDYNLIFGDKLIDQKYSDFDIIIYHEGLFGYSYQTSSFHRTVLDNPSPEVIRRENELYQALEKGNIVCILESKSNDYIFSRIMNTYNIYFSEIYQRNIYNTFKVKRSEFKIFLDNVGATTISFSDAEIDNVIATLQDSHIIGFSKQIGKGLLIVLTCVWGSTSISYVIDNIENLTNGIIAYSARTFIEPPKWILETFFENERNVKSDIERIKNDLLAPLLIKIDNYNKLKSILWLGEKALEEASNHFIQKMGFQTLVDEVYEEDFWILDNEQEKIIVEVKSKNKNLSRQDISKFDEHREARQKPDMTGLLIANTFIIANSIDEKDKPFSPNVIEKAVNSNFIITRTIDLCRIYDKLEREGNLNSNYFLNEIDGKKGWLTISDNEIIIID